MIGFLPFIGGAASMIGGAIKGLFGGGLASKAASAVGNMFGYNPKPPSIWERIGGFFGFKKKPPSNPILDFASSAAGTAGNFLTSYLGSKLGSRIAASPQAINPQMIGSGGNIQNINQYQGYGDRNAYDNNISHEQALSLNSRINSQYVDNPQLKKSSLQDILNKLNGV